MLNESPTKPDHETLNKLPKGGGLNIVRQNKQQNNLSELSTICVVCIQGFYDPLLCRTLCLLLLLLVESDTPSPWGMGADWVMD